MKARLNFVTPVALADKSILERNISDAAEFAGRHGIALRPHIKTHKSPEIARMQTAAGAVGITCATIDEAVGFADAGFRDIFIAYPIVDGARLEILKKLRGSSEVIVSVDSDEHISILEATGIAGKIRVRIEIDSGHHRCGLPPGKPVVDLARRVAASPCLVLDGVFTHAGHVYGAKTPDERLMISEAEGRAVVSAAKMIRDAGIACHNASVGSTPTWRVSGTIPGVTEARPGNYVYNDAIQVGLGVAKPEDCAFTVLTTVVAVYDDRFVVDAGSKAMGLDKGAHGIDLLKGYGILLTPDGKVARDWMLSRLSEEHGIAQIAPAVCSPRIGDTLRIIPNHSCAAANMYSSIYITDDTGGMTAHPLVGRHK